ncbi:hypothetical protein VN24_08345 [Paenibacillus beijingensis]|uniref:Stage II sporulation protein R n=1 Tax=Paenibacillus beijingensis TaxID=1126833 RepID=A0A0D5NQK8_9BACL|nr:hypothetical protein VN24_08345 [Paenibacillus beijingensis]
MSYGYLIVALALLVMSWEGQRVDGALSEDAGSIPQQAIRLRILANSDAAVDQAMKRRVRDAVVSAMNGWADGPQTIEEARAALRGHMGDIERIVGEQLQSRGVQYGFKAELGEVAFPTKLYGERVYPAGNYEALLITLGKGEGQNWWCVLFPPLCFIDSASGEATQTEAAAAKKGADGKAVQVQEVVKDGNAVKQASAAVNNGKADKQASEPVTAGKTAKADAGSGVQQSSVQAEGGSAAAKGKAAAPEAKFFIVELIQSIVSFFKHLFA